MPPKFIVFDGRRYCRDDATGYYKTNRRGRSPTYLHRDVWERHRGPIPDGFEIHHPHRDKHTTDPARLECLPGDVHARLSGAELTDEQRASMRRNLIERAGPASAEWHRSDAGREWHARHARHQLARRVVEGDCQQCGKHYRRTGAIRTGAFCSNACKSAWRRASGADDVQRECAHCRRAFTVNRYRRTRCCSRECAQALRHGR